MDFTVPIPKKGSPLDKKQQKQVLDYLGQNAKIFLQNRIDEVYRINSQIRTEENYIPKQEMFESLNMSFSSDNSSVSIYLDEKEIEFRDSQGREIWEVAPGDWFLKNGAKVDNLEEHWRTPISGVQEEEYFFNLAINDLKQFIDKKLSNYILQISKGGNK